MNKLKRIIEIIETVESKISEDSNVLWTSYSSAAELKAEINKDLKALKKGDLNKLEAFKVHFLPTSTFQEISLSNNWNTEFLELASEYEQLYEKLKNESAF